MGSPHNDFCFQSFALFLLFHVVLSLCGGVGGGGGGGIPSDYFVSTQLQLSLFCCWGCGCCWAVTIICGTQDFLADILLVCLDLQYPGIEFIKKGTVFLHTSRKIVSFMTLEVASKSYP